MPQRKTNNGYADRKGRSRKAQKWKGGKPSFMKRARSAKIEAPKELRAETRNNKEEIMDMTM